MTVAVVNYGMGNLGSVARALRDLGADVLIALTPEALREASHIILPGVGAFGDAMACLREGGWVDVIRDEVLVKGTPLLGICLGMQMLASVSEENGVHDGLNLIPARVLRLDDLGCGHRIPHVGWNNVDYTRDSKLFAQIPDETDFYFVHSYAMVPEDEGDASGTTDYDIPVTAAVERANVFGTQFHPEKSAGAGRQVLQNFLLADGC